MNRAVRLRVWIAPLLALAVGWLSGCGGEEPADPASQAATTTPGEPDTLVIAIQADGQTLDPHKAVDAGSMRLIENLYSTLMRYTPAYGEIEPDLLVDWQADDEFTRFTLTLKEGLTFHSGRPITAGDVKFSLNRIRESGLRDEPLADLESIEVVDERTVELRFARPMSPLMTYLAHPMYAIVDRQAVEELGGDLSQATAGSGPFQLVRWQKDREAVVEAFDDYHVDGLPKVERLVYRPIPDDSARSIALVNREVDIVLDVPVQEIEPLQGHDHLTIDSVPGTFWEYIGLNCARAPFDDPRVRQAVAWAVDRQMLNQAVKRGRATVLDGGHIPPHHWAHADLELYPQRDPAKARQLLADAGYPDGFETTLIVGSDFSYQVAAAEIVKQQLAPVGIRVNLQRLESTQFFQRLGAGDFEATLVGWIGFVDPDEWCYPIYHTDGKYNQQSYTDEQVDRWLAEGRTVRDRAERRAIYAKIQRCIAADAPTVFLYVNDRVSAHLNRVENFVVHPTATTIFLRSTSITKATPQ